MERNPIDSRIGFADAEFKSYSKEDDTFVVDVLAWNESIITIIFKDVIRILDNDVNAISAFCEVIENNDFIQTALKRLYEGDLPSDHPYKHYQFLDNDDIPALEVVSGSMDIQYS